MASSGLPAERGFHGASRKKSACMLPSGTSKWKRIEHRLFSFSNVTWRAKPLVSYCVIIDLIGATTTK